jgi:hypothetical protein
MYIGLALVTMLVPHGSGLEARFPALSWITWGRWPLAAWWLWKGVQLLREPDRLQRALVGERKSKRIRSNGDRSPTSLNRLP